jgi:hypothetical protein
VIDWHEKLEQLRVAHAEGNPDAARKALRVCAVAGLPLPRWLAMIVMRAVGTFEVGKEDTVLGFGSESMRVRLGKRYRKARGEELQRTYRFYRDELGMPATDVMALLVEGTGESDSTIKKALWPARSPTKSKKRMVR